MSKRNVSAERARVKARERARIGRARNRAGIDGVSNPSRVASDKVGTGKTLKILKTIDKAIGKIRRESETESVAKGMGIKLDATDRDSAKQELKLAKAEARRWKPVRRGSRYCSPACGRGCTVAEHQQAKATAKKLAKELGAGWTFRVYENMGWHHEAISKSGRVRVIKSKHGYYSAHIGDNGDQGCYWSGTGNTARAAIDAAKARACEALTKNLGRYFDLMPGERVAGFSIQAANGNGKTAKVRGMHLLK